MQALEEEGLFDAALTTPTVHLHGEPVARLWRVCGASVARATPQCRPQWLWVLCTGEADPMLARSRSMVTLYAVPMQHCTDVCSRVCICHVTYWHYASPDSISCPCRVEVRFSCTVLAIRW